MSEKKTDKSEKLDAIVASLAEKMATKPRIGMIDSLGGVELTALLASLVLVLIVMLNPGGGISETAFVDGGAVDQLFGLLTVALPGLFVARPASHWAKGQRAKKEAEAEAARPKE